MENDRFRSKLSAYKDGELDVSLSEQVSRHLQNCAACSKELAELERVDSLVGKMPIIEAGESFSLQIMARISTEAQYHPGSKPFSRLIFAKLLQLADSIFELVSGHEQREDTLDEFGDFPPLSMTHAYFHAIGQQR